MRRRRAGALSAAGGVVAVALLAASLAPLAAWGAGQAVPAQPAPRPPDPRSFDDLFPALPKLHDRLVLDDTTVTAGTAIHGTLVVVNQGKRPIDLTAGCRPKYAVALEGPGYTPGPVFTTTCDTRPFVFGPGTTRLPVAVQTTYLACSDTPEGSTPSGVLPCTGSGPPPLPAGRYTAVLVELVGPATGWGLPRPKPVVVTIGR
ncbi:MAG TPA: hypothetical protein VHB02_04035 [Acidimicrobiales bacterium]|nr:hypothetical protein [Acidimicrobiales bacterium]